MMQRLHATLAARAPAPALPPTRTHRPTPHAGSSLCLLHRAPVAGARRRGLPARATPFGEDAAVAAAAATASAPTPPPPLPPPPADLVLIGTIGAPHGLKGELRVFPVTDDPAGRLGRAGAAAWAAPRAGGRALGGRAGGGKGAPTHARLTILSGRPALLKGREVWLVRVKGVTNPEDASVLCNQELWVSAAER